MMGTWLGCCNFFMFFLMTEAEEVNGTPAPLIMNSSLEYNLRRALFEEQVYDKTVRPVTHPLEHIHMNFSLRLQKINVVNIKDQSISVDAWVIQTWVNPYLTWNPTNHGRIERIQVKATQIWVPDIILYNNVDTFTPMAGGTAKFLGPVVLSYDGVNRWFSPVSLKASCDMDVRSWPFDSQTCTLKFGSMSQGLGQLNLYSFDDTHKAVGFIASGEWMIMEVSSYVNQTTLGCCPFPFSQYNYAITIHRRSIYYLVYLVLPCTVLSALTLISFTIPCESGERIGFCITTLLAMSVYLLLVADSVPKTSDQIPILGVYFILSFLEIFLALITTIVVLKIYHKRGEPSKKMADVFSRFRRSCYKNSKVTSRNDCSTRSVVSAPMTDSGLVESASQETPYRPDKSQHTPEENKLSWKEISEIVDRFMFYMILFFTLCIYFVFV